MELAPFPFLSPQLHSSLENQLPHNHVVCENQYQQAEKQNTFGDFRRDLRFTFWKTPGNPHVQGLFFFFFHLSQNLLCMNRVFDRVFVENN